MALTGLAQGSAGMVLHTPTQTMSEAYCRKKSMQKIGQTQKIYLFARVKHGNVSTTLSGCISEPCYRQTGHYKDIQTEHNDMYLVFLSRKVVCEECSTAQIGSSTESGTSRAWQGMVARRHTWKLPSLL